jgi:Xaa-Pro aminopeptidase
MFQSFDPPQTAQATAPRVAALRELMAKLGLEAFLIPRADEHQNEYVPPCAERLAWNTGFTGSAGLAVVAAKSAAVFVDGRYTVQAPQEVDTTIFDVKGIRSTDLLPWLAQALPVNATVGFDPKLHTLAEIEQLKPQLEEKGFTLKAVSRNLVDRVWATGRPAEPNGPIVVQPLERAGRAPAEKVAELQKTLKAASQDAVVLTAPDSICWLLNIRGSDVAHNPIVLAYAIVPVSGKPELFVASAKLTAQAKSHLTPLVKLRSPDALDDALNALKASQKTIRVAPGASWWLYKKLGGGKSEAKRIKKAADPCTEPKAIKNAAEIEGARAAHIRDGIAVTRFLAWFDKAIAKGGLDEITAVTALEAMRHDTGALKEISFPTISGSGPHGAIVHYRVTQATNRTVIPGELFLLDSGGQYADGTTDITRTLATGTPTKEMRARFTLVLKGMIAVTLAKFPRGTRGIDLDPFARRALWAAGLNYDHGTGHGVGSYLSVHEGPQSISKAGMVELKSGMICSNEPGYYKAGSYGIRIENLVVVTEPKDVGGEAPVMGFETLTLVPIDRRLIVAEMLDPAERTWLDAYHKRVADTLSPLVDPDTRRWLKAATAKL